MHFNRNLVWGKRRYLFGAIILLSISVICVAFSMDDSGDFDTSRREVLIRRIGHELLLQSGDSKSRVLPVEKIAENEYQIRFENDFSFLPDSLVNTTRRLLANDPLAHNYVVNVMSCGKEGVIYGYAISQNKKDDIVTCLGRVQPRACYRINIKFKPTGINAITKGYIFGGMPFLAFVGFLFLRSVKPRRGIAGSRDTDVLTLGTVCFDAKNGKLIINGKTIDLTGTETRVLRIFALSPNETIERSRLQKEIWEDAGIIVGRSLDMFISKLRKKLELDPNINIVVIRGKGYKLEIN
jgi:hypothetical protein